MNEPQLEDFFAGFPESRAIFAALRKAVQRLGPSEIRVAKSQVALRRKKNFAIVSIPEKHLKRQAAPLVLTISFPHKDPSPRWKEVVEPAPGRFTHHLELHSAGEIDGEVIRWLISAYDAAK